MLYSEYPGRHASENQATLAEGQRDGKPPTRGSRKKPRASRADELDRSRDPTTAPLPIAYSLEVFESISAEIDTLAQASWNETVLPLEPGRIYGLDKDSMTRMSQVGVLKIITARQGSELVGFISWVLQFDLESYGTLIAQQGAWYARPGIWGLGWGTFMASLEVLRELGVKFCYPHHRLAGRSASGERFFRRLGGVPIMTVYSLSLSSAATLLKAPA